jgi:hypothetical protein
MWHDSITCNLTQPINHTLYRYHTQSQHANTATMARSFEARESDITHLRVMWLIHMWLVHCDLFMCDLFICDWFMCDWFMCDMWLIHMWLIHMWLIHMWLIHMWLIHMWVIHIWLIHMLLIHMSNRSLTCTWLTIACNLTNYTHNHTLHHSVPTRRRWHGALRRACLSSIRLSWILWCTLTPSTRWSQRVPKKASLKSMQICLYISIVYTLYVYAYVYTYVYKYLCFCVYV